MTILASLLPTLLFSSLAGPTGPTEDAVGPAFEPAPVVVGEHRFERRTLANGLEAIAVQQPGTQASVFMVVGAGNAMEGPSTSGLAHLVEHTMYTGTALKGTDEHERTVVAWGGESNAFTREDYTLYYDHDFPAEHIATVLAMEADRLRGLTFDLEPFLHERWRLEHEEAGAFTQAEARSELLDAALFQAGPYGAGVRSPEGHTMAPDLPIELVRSFYDLWYHPNHTAVVVAAPGDPGAALDAIEASFAHLPIGPSGAPMATEPDARRGGSFAFDSSLPGDKLYHAWVGPARVERDGVLDSSWGDRIALVLVAHVLGERHRDDDGAPLEVSMGGRAQRDLFLLGCGGGDAEERLLALRAELDESPLTEAELADAVAELGDDFESIPVAARPYFSLAGTVGIHAVLGDATWPARWPARLASITTADTIAVVERWVDPERLVAVTFVGSGELESGEGLVLPEDPSELAAFAQDASEAGDYASAIAAYERLLELGPDRMNAVIYGFYLGTLKRESGDLVGALADLEAALEVVDYPAVRELADEIRAELEGGAPTESSDEPAEDPAGDPAGDPHAAADPHGATGSGAQVTSSGELAPGFAAEAAAVLADLETWRGLTFTDDLLVEFVAAEDAYAEKINGWYEPDTKRLVVVENDNQAMGRGTMLHEMFHALQDQRFDLERLHTEAWELPDAGEADRALRAIIEGEAMLAVAELMDYDFEQHTALPTEGELDEARFEKIFHYGAGLRFVRALRDAGGWGQVDAAFRTPPRTTAEILHPDRYLAGMAREDLGGLPTPECVCSEEHQDARVLGEYGLSLFLARDVATRSESARLAARLAGDLCHRIHDEESGADRYAWYLSFHDGVAADAFTELATGVLGLEAWALDESGRRIGILLATDPLPDGDEE